MLHESPASQKEKDVFRRWFQDDYFDLIVWYSPDRSVIDGFQLCYDKNRDEHAFTWHRTAGFGHNKIDNSRGALGHPATPILVNDGFFPFDEIMKRFNRSSDELDEQIRDLVVEKLIEFSKIITP
jgi:hypothetical protein